MAPISQEPPTTRTSFDLDANGAPIIPQPPPPQRSILRYVCLPCVMHTIFPIAFPFTCWPTKVKNLISELRELFQLVFSSMENPISQSKEYQDDEIIKQVYNSSSAKHYLENNAFEWQLREGYAQRPHRFPVSIVLCGVRDVRDHRIAWFQIWFTAFPNGLLELGR